MNHILIIGATGNVGRQVLSQLPGTGVRVRALARNPHTAGLPPHVDVVRGDLTVAETLDECLDGIDAVFLVWCAPPAAVTPALERIVRHTQRIVFLSSPYKTAHPFFQRGQPNPVAALHAEIERLIETSGRQWTFLRPGMFAANALRWWAPQIRAGGDVVRWLHYDALAREHHCRKSLLLDDKVCYRLANYGQGIHTIGTNSGGRRGAPNAGSGQRQFNFVNNLAEEPMAEPCDQLSPSVVEHYRLLFRFRPERASGIELPEAVVGS
jgi:hypothetical protein